LSYTRAGSDVDDLAALGQGFRRELPPEAGWWER